MPLLRGTDATPLRSSACSGLFSASSLAIAFNPLASSAIRGAGEGVSGLPLDKLDPKDRYFPPNGIEVSKECAE